jgi:hypothetical protein
VVLTTCHYVFLVETAWFSYSDAAFFNRTDDFAVPVVLDWAIRNVGSCSAARRNATGFACRSANSDCFDSIGNGAGYRCNCSKGYEGNPYLDGGCRGTRLVSSHLNATSSLQISTVLPVRLYLTMKLLLQNGRHRRVRPQRRIPMPRRLHK